MATTSNFLLSCISGRIGNIVIRQQNGKAVICARPSKKKKKPLTEQQLQHQERFKRAAAFAKQQMDNPETKRNYERMARVKKLPNAYTAAVSTYMNSNKM